MRIRFKIILTMLVIIMFFTLSNSLEVFASNATITNATYNSSTGILTVTGEGMNIGDTIVVDNLTITGEGGINHTLTTNDIVTNSTTVFAITLNSADKRILSQIMNKNGVSSTGGTVYNLAVLDGWDSNAAVADTTNPITVTNVAVPTITNATYDPDEGRLSVTGTNFLSYVGADNDIDVSKLTITGEGGTYTLTSADDVDIISRTSFDIILSMIDKTNVNSKLNKIGTTSIGNVTYNIAAADNWARGADNAVDIADVSPNAISVIVYPKISSATYDAASGTISVTGTNFSSKAGTADIDASKFTITGEGGNTYTISNITPDVEIISDTLFTINISATDKNAIGMIINKNGTSSTGGTVYNLAAADDWVTGVTDGDTADITGNPITASNVAVPTITNATYDVATGIISVTGSNFSSYVGANNDIDASKFTITGEGGNTYTLTDTADVDITSPTTFTITLSETDKNAIGMIINKNGTSSAGGTVYNLAAGEDWAMGADVKINIADVTGNTISVSNAPVPTIINASYDVATGIISVTGSNFLPYVGDDNDIDASKFTITGEGGNTYTLTDTADVDIISSTLFTMNISVTDKNATQMIINKNGTSSTGDTVYNLSAGEDWATGADAATNIADTTGNAISVSNVAVPTITNTTYDVATGILSVTGSNFLSYAGANNDIDASKFTITGEGGDTYTLTDTADVDIISSTLFTMNISATDKNATQMIINKNGTSSTGGTVYNLTAGEDWAMGADNAVDIADTTGNAISVSNVAVPTITNVTYYIDYGIISVTGSNFLSYVGANNDIDASKFTITGEGGSYTLTDTADIDIISRTSFNITLSAEDKMHVDSKLDIPGVSSSGGTIYNIAAGEDWATGADAGINIADVTGNGIVTRSTFALIPTISEPSRLSTSNDDVTFTIDYTGAANITLTDKNVKLNTTGTANGIITVLGTSAAERTVRISGITGDGTLDISIGMNTAVDATGNHAAPAGPTTGVIVDNTAPTGTIKINNDAEYTTNVNLILNITSDDDAGTGVSHMRFQVNDNAWSSWENIDSAKAIATSSDYGPITVKMQLKDVEQNISNILSDTIIYNKASSGSSSKKKNNERVIGIKINNKTLNVGKVVTTQNKDKQILTTITLDKQKFFVDKNDSTIGISFDEKSDIFVLELDGQTMENMERKQTTLEIKIPAATYVLPVKQMNMNQILSQMEPQVKMKDIKVSVRITKPTRETLKKLEDSAKEKGVTMITEPLDFNVECIIKQKKVNINKFNRYVERTIALPDGVDASKRITGIRYNEDGTFTHIPTALQKIEGKYYAKIKSLTNSTYSVIYSEKTFEDVKNHWSKDDVEDMASRLIINGVDVDSFDPDRDITRAEFSAIVVRSLGLESEVDSESLFTDVDTDKWYNDVVSIGNSYELIKGYEDKSFKPNNQITREEAMVIMIRALKLANMDLEQYSKDESLLTAFEDYTNVSNWSREYVSICVNLGLVNGKNNNIAAKENITRAETATIIRRMLKTAELIEK